jgi:hypothetical protein
VARTLLVWRLQISDRVADKIKSEHGVSPAQVREAVVGVGPLPFRWDHHPSRGDRALVVTAIDDDPVLVVLYPATTGNAEEWWLGSVYPI